MITSEQIYKAILDFNLKMAGTKNFQAIVPCFVGYTGTGKTTRAVQDARERNYPMFRQLLQTMLPEDTNGLPRVIDGVTVWADTTWARALKAAPGLLFYDEMDKPRAETLSSVLTTMAEKRVRDLTLHPQTLIAAAMQPVSASEWLSDQTGQALSARMCFIPVLQDWNFVGTKHGIELAFMKGEKSVELPILPQPSPRQVDWFIPFCRHHYKDKALWEAVAQGMFPKDVSDALMEEIKEGMSSGNVTREDLVSVLKKDQQKLIAKLTVPELCILAPDIFHHGTCATLEDSLERVWCEGDEDNTRTYLENQYNGLMERLEANGGTLETNAGASEEEVQQAIENAAWRIGEGPRGWVHRAKDGKKEGNAAKAKKK